MKSYGTAGALVAARGEVDVPTTALVRPAHWPARIDRNRVVRSPVAAALEARTAEDRAGERALSAERTAEALAARKARRRRGAEPAARTPKGTEDVAALREAVLADVRRRVAAGETDDVIAAALRVSCRRVKDLRAEAGAHRGTPRRPHGSRLLDEIAKGGTVEEIAARVPCSPSTVVRARARIRKAAADADDAAPVAEPDPVPAVVDDAGTLPEVAAGLARMTPAAPLILSGEGERTPRVAELLDERFGGSVDAVRRERGATSRPYDPTLARAHTAARARTTS